MTVAQPLPLKRIKLRIRRALSPWRIRMGPGSYIARPYRVSNPECIEMGANVMILPDSTVQPITRHGSLRYSPRIVLGDGVYVGRHAVLHAIGRLEIEAGSVLSEYVFINDASHGFDPDGPPIMEQPPVSRGPVHIGRNCFLGYRAVVMPGVTLGERCIVGANSVVTRSFPPYSIVGGVPARLIKRYGPAAAKAQEPA